MSTCAERVRCWTMGTSSGDQQPQSGGNSSAQLMQTLTEDCRRHWGRQMEGIALVWFPYLILHRLNRDLIAQMSCNPAIGGIPLGRHANRTCLSRSRRECPRHTLDSGMQSPGRNQGVIVKQCAEKYVNHDVDCPDQPIGHCHFAWLPQDIPEKQNIQGNRSGNHRPLRCTQALDTVSQQADKTADCKRSKDVRLFLNQVETEPPR